MEMANLCRYTSSCIGILHARSGKLGAKLAMTRFLDEIESAGLSRKSGQRRHQEARLVSTILASLPKGVITGRFLKTFFGDKMYGVIRSAVRTDRGDNVRDDKVFVSQVCEELMSSFGGPSSIQGHEIINQSPIDLLDFFQSLFPQVTEAEISEAISFTPIVDSALTITYENREENRQIGRAHV